MWWIAGAELLGCFVFCHGGVGVQSIGVLSDVERALISFRHELPIFQVQVSILAVVKNWRNLALKMVGGLQIPCLLWI